MQQLFDAYSITEIISFIIILAIAIKGAISFYDWGKDRLRKIFNKEEQQNKDKQSIEDKIENFEKRINEIANSQKNTNSAIEELTQKINMLIVSDKNDIKSFITEKHHFFCYTQHWIDDYSLECLEYRFSIYQKENGNSFVEGLMEEIRALPKHPPNE